MSTIEPLTTIHNGLLITEEFKVIPGYEGCYECSTFGRILSLAKWGSPHPNILKTSFDKYGYEIVTLYKQYKGENCTVHQLVAITFLGHIKNGNTIVVDHINDIKTDNRLVNLQLITNRANVVKGLDLSKKDSKYIGVVRNRDKWVSKIWFEGKQIYLGNFTTEKEASLYYKNALDSILKGEEIKVKKPVFTSKYKGVYFDKSRSRWAARKDKKHLGRFKTEWEAHLRVVEYNNLKTA